MKSKTDKTIVKKAVFYVVLSVVLLTSLLSGSRRYEHMRVTHCSFFRKALYVAHLYLLGNHSSFIDTLTFYSLQFYGMVLLLYLNFRLIKRSASTGVATKADMPYSEIGRHL